MKPDYEMKPSIPEKGYLRLQQILQYIPIAKSTWWYWVQKGIAPQPYKLSANTTVWKVTEINEMLEKAEMRSNK